MYARRKGFTLIELLVVIIIISILAGGMLLSQWRSEATAQATVVVSDLRLMKSAAYAFFFDSNDMTPVAGVNYAELLGKYMDHGRIINDPVRYAFYVVGDLWWVGVKVQGTANVNSILEGKAGSTVTAPLYGSNNIESPPAAPDAAHLYKHTNIAVWMRAR